MNLPESAWSKAHPGIPPRRQEAKGISIAGLIQIGAAKALAMYNAESRQLNQVMTPEKRKQLADELRQTADELERG